MQIKHQGSYYNVIQWNCYVYIVHVLRHSTNNWFGVQNHTISIFFFWGLLIISLYALLNLSKLTISIVILISAVIVYSVPYNWLISSPSRTTRIINFSTRIFSHFLWCQIFTGCRCWLHSRCISHNSIFGSILRHLLKLIIFQYLSITETGFLWISEICQNATINPRHFGIFRLTGKIARRILRMKPLTLLKVIESIPLKLNKCFRFMNDWLNT